jgi:hypothetical protein
MNGPCCGKVSTLVLKVQVTQDVKALTCVDCALAMLHAQAEANSALVQRLAALLDRSSVGGCPCFGGATDCPKCGAVNSSRWCLCGHRCKCVASPGDNGWREP